MVQMRLAPEMIAHMKYFTIRVNEKIVIRDKMWNIGLKRGETITISSLNVLIWKGHKILPLPFHTGKIISKRVKKHIRVGTNV